MRELRILKYWFKIIKLNNNNPVKIIYNLLVRELNVNENVKNWASLFKDLLDRNGFGNVWIEQNVQNEQMFLSIFENRIKDIFVQNNNASLVNLSEHRLYRYLGHSHELAKYLVLIKEKYIRIALTKLRLGSHNLMVERGRWTRPITDFNQRLCSECLEIEDEYHVVLRCRRFAILRKKYIPNSLVQKPSMFEFIKLINTEDENKLRKLGIFCHKAFNEYNNEVL